MSEGWIERVVLSNTNTTLYGTMQATARASVRLSAHIGWQPPEKGNLVFVVTGDQLTEARAGVLGFIKTSTGFYKYLRTSVSRNRLCFEFETIPEITGFHIRPWNMTAPVVLEDVVIESAEAEVGFVREPRRAIRKWHPLTPAGTRVLAASFLLRKSRCGPECVAHCHKWFDSMDEFARRAQSAQYGRDEVYVETRSSELIPASLHRAAPAFLEIPGSIDEYLREIGDKSRNMIRKARKLGYVFQPLGPVEFGDDIHAIRTSDPMRQGRPIPEYFYTNPPTYVISYSGVGCALHTEKFFGVFKDGRLVSYITLFMFGEFAQVNHILCHKEHVASGVMNLNIMHMVDELIRNDGHVKAVNYMYLSEANVGIDVFRRSVGFRPRRFLTYDSVMTMFSDEPAAGDGDAKKEERTPEAMAGTKKSRPRLAAWTFVRDTLDADNALEVIAQRVGRSVQELQAPSPDGFVPYVSRQLGALAAGHARGTCYALPFPGRVSGSVDEAVAAYIEKRFKGNPVPDHGFQSGFKGGDFRALGYFEVVQWSDAFCNGYLVLEKVNEEASDEKAQAIAKLAVPKVMDDARFVASLGKLPARLDRVQLANDYQPLASDWLEGGVTQMLFMVGTARVEVRLNEKFGWNHRFASNAETMWYYSLSFVGQLLATWLKHKDEAARDLAVSLVTDFINFANADENRHRIGMIPSADHSTSERLKVLLALNQLIQTDDRPAVVQFRRRLLREIHKWAEWLADDENLGVGNHKLMGATSLIYVYSLLEGAAGAGYLEIASQRVVALATDSFDKDGLCNENTIGYHNFNLSLYRKLLALLNTLEIAGHLRGHIEPLIARAASALELCVFPDGKIPPIGDSPRYDLGLKSRNGAFCFFESGFAVVKRDDLYFSLICGSRTEWHKQMDDSAIYLQYKGVDVVIDAGSHSYDHTNPYTRAVTSSTGHSGIFLSKFDGMPRHEVQAKFGPVSGRISRFEESKEGVRIACNYAVQGCDAAFTRFVFVGAAGEVVLVDTVDAPEGEDVVQRFVLGPTIDAVAEEGRVRLAAPGFAGSIIHGVDAVDLYRGEAEHKIRGWSTYEFGKISPTAGIDVRRGPGQTVYSTIIRLGDGGLDDCSAAARHFATQKDAFFAQ
jgi:hypothetical protein